MKERLIALKNKATERANYYSGIGFTILAEEFTEFANFLNEIENTIEKGESQNEEISEN